jgi:6-phosphogluconate dehydrogenase
MEKKADIGLIGLAVMGQNLVLNMDDHGYTVAVYNRTTSKMTDFIHNEAAGTNVIGAETLEELVSLLERPRKVMLMVKAGKPVDLTIESLLPFLEPGDIIIDGGNSNFEDTIRRSCRVAQRKPGRTSDRSSRILLPKWKTEHHAVTGLELTGRGILSKWSTTVSSTVICS